MRNRTSYLAAIALLVFVSAVYPATRTEELAINAASTDAAASSAAIRELREMGPTGLEALFAKYAVEVAKYSATGDGGENWPRIANALDTVGMQKDDYASHLYWYTDLDAAKRAASLQNKPILSLRLLGNLNEEFSCANSRLFRATLYSNGDIAKFLHDNYILHWRSVRPAPRITIDFGDGRKIERTITGNSIHYILMPDGTVIDAIPGLYGPEMFLSYLKLGLDQYVAARGLKGAPLTLALMKFRKRNFDDIVAKRDKTIQKAGVQMTETKTGTLAILAAPMAMAKAIVVDEYSILRVYDDFAKFEPSVKYDDWSKLASVYSANNALHPNSVAMIRRQNAKTGLTEDELKGMFAKLDKFIALDTTRNDFLFHTKLYEWLNQGRRGSETVDLETLNSEVYDKIFQTPDYDKWLGLYSNDVYTALDGNGIVK
jgi:hypothetical protein